MEGRRHGMTTDNDSSMDELLAERFSVDGTLLFLSEDSAYVLRMWMQLAYSGNVTRQR